MHWTLLSWDGGQTLEAHDLHTFSTNQDSTIPGKLGSFDYSDTHSVGVLHTGNIAQGEQQKVNEQFWKEKNDARKMKQLVTDQKVNEFWNLVAGLAVEEEIIFTI